MNISGKSCSAELEGKPALNISVKSYFPPFATASGREIDSTSDATRSCCVGIVRIAECPWECSDILCSSTKVSKMFEGTSKATSIPLCPPICESVLLYVVAELPL